MYYCIWFIIQHQHPMFDFDNLTDEEHLVLYQTLPKKVKECSACVHVPCHGCLMTVIQIEEWLEWRIRVIAFLLKHQPLVVSRGYSSLCPLVLG